MFFSFGIIGMVACVAATNEKKVERIGFAFLATIFFFFLVGHEAFNQGRLEERTLNPAHNYIVKAKKQGNDIPLVVYDMVDKKDRVIDLEGYPPSGFSEVITADGKIMLIPVSK